MAGVVGAFVWREEAKRDRDQGTDLIKAPGPRGPEERFQFGKRELDGIEVRAIGRKEAHAPARLRNGRPHPGLLVRREVIEHDDIARPERRHEDLFDIREKRRVIDGPVEDRRRRQAVEPERRDHGVRLPMTAGRVITEPRTAWTTAVAP